MNLCLHKNKMAESTEKKLITLWILLLSFANGFANVLALLRFVYPVSHVTGLTSQLALAMARGELGPLGILLRGFLLFFLGSTLAGILFYQRDFQPKKRYGGILFIGGILVFLLKNTPLLHLFLFFYMGVINGMFIFYRDVVVRTTHVTGYLTDAGFELGAALRGGRGHGWKILFYLGSIGLFFLGGYLATLEWKDPVMLLAFTYIFLGGYYFVVRRRHFRSR